MFEELIKSLKNSTIKGLDSLPPQELKLQLQQIKFPSLGLRIDSANNISAYKKECEQIRKVAYHWPSAGLTAVMHSHTVMMFARYPKMFASSGQVFESILNNQSLVVSLTADGSMGKNKSLTPVLFERISEREIRLNGIKKPASLANIADYFVCLSKENSPGNQKPTAAMSLMPRSNNIIAINGFWQIPTLEASDTQIVNFKNVQVPLSDTIFEGEQYSKAGTLALTVAQYMYIQCYLGIAERLIDLIIQRFKPFYELRASIARINMFRESYLEVLAEQSFIADESQNAKNFVHASRFTLEHYFDELIKGIHKHVSGVALFSEPDYQHLMNTLMMLRYHPHSEKKFLSYFAAKFTT